MNERNFNYYWKRFPFHLIMIWIAILSLFYLFIYRSNRLNNNFTIDNNVNKEIIENLIESSNVFDSIVYIAMGGLAGSRSIDFNIASLRLVGQWKGKIFIITDSSDCFELLKQKYDIDIISLPHLNSIIEIKAIKTRLFDYLPNDVNGIMYIDVDVLIRQNLFHFYRDLLEYFNNHNIYSHININNNNNNQSTRLRRLDNSTYSHAVPLRNEHSFDFAAFPDAKGHFFGFCSGCDKWHTGIMLFRRSHNSNCLNAWREILLSGKYSTDQQSLDEADRRGECSRGLMLPSNHLLFAKDYFGMMLTSGQTFVHLTAIANIDSQDYVYSHLVVPHVRHSLEPALVFRDDFDDKYKNCTSKS